MKPRAYTACMYRVMYACFSVSYEIELPSVLTVARPKLDTPTSSSKFRSLLNCSKRAGHSGLYSLYSLPYQAFTPGQRAFAKLPVVIRAIVYSPLLTRANVPEGAVRVVIDFNKDLIVRTNNIVRPLHNLHNLQRRRVSSSRQS